MASERLWCSLLRPAAVALLPSPLSRGFSIYKRQMKTETKMTIGFNSKQQKQRNRDTQREREREVVKIIKTLIGDVVVRQLWNESSLLLIKYLKCDFQLWLQCRVTMSHVPMRYPSCLLPCTLSCSLWVAMFMELKLWYEATVLLQIVCTVVCNNQICTNI